MLKRWLGFLGNMRRAASKGGLFPGRPSPREAPGGSTEHPRRGNILWRLIDEHRWLTTSEHRVPLSSLQQTITVLHLSDIHLRGQDRDLDALCEAIGGFTVDLVVITGDTVTFGWTEGAVHQLLQSLPDAPLGKFAIMGNWEYWARALPAPWAEILAPFGVQLLRESWVDLGPIILAGTDDMWAGETDPEALLGTIPPDRAVLMLTHSPNLFPALVDPRVKLVLAGHTHGGQMRLPAIGAFWTPRGTGPYIGGWYQEDHTHLFVSRGLGWSVAPLRLFCSPELALIHLTPGR